MNEVQTRSDAENSPFLLPILFPIPVNVELLIIKKFLLS
jgi:hypothetical protein